VIDEANGVELRRIVVGYLDTNCWVVKPAAGREALIVDPGDEPRRIAEAVSDLDVTGIVITHAHADHVLAVAALAGEFGVPVIGHPDEPGVWAGELAYLAEHGHLDAGTATPDLVAGGNLPRPSPDLPLWDGHLDHYPNQISLGPLTVELLHTPGHTPGSLCLRLPGHLLSGDTLFPGGPGLTGPQWPLSDFTAIIASVQRLLDLPPDTVIHPGHGSDTTIATERPHLDAWRARGW
jgi:glyoxylase-like metal-dependent hydrolase (beta-lactamase superfamily II)